MMQAFACVNIIDIESAIRLQTSAGHVHIDGLV